MMRHTIETAIATGRFPYGSPVLFRDGRASAAPIGAANAIAKRPHRAGGRTHTADGDQLHVCIEGGLLAEIDGYSRWVTVVDGHIGAGGPL